MLHKSIINIKFMAKDNKKIKISVRGLGLVYSGEVDKLTAGRIIDLCLSATANLGAVHSPGFERIINNPGSISESPAEYIERHAPRRGIDRILTMAGYLKEVVGKVFFTQNEVKGYLKDAGESLPANPTRDFKWLVKSTWVAIGDKKKKQYYITNTGLKVLKDGFPDELIKKSRGKANK